MAIEWVAQRYSGSEATLGYGLNLSVSYEGKKRLPVGENAWNVYVFGRQLKERSPDEDDAKARAERTAKRWLEIAASKLST